MAQFESQSKSVLASTLDFVDSSFSSPSIVLYLFAIPLAVVYLSVVYRLIRDKSFRSRVRRTYNNLFSSILSVFGAFFGAKVEFVDEISSTTRDQAILDVIRSELSASGIKLSDASEAEIIGYFREALSGDLREQIQNELRTLIDREVSSAVQVEVDGNYILELAACDLYGGRDVNTVPTGRYD